MVFEAENVSFYASSILIFYESNLESIYQDNNNNETIGSNEEKCRGLIRAKLADLTHVFRPMAKVTKTFYLELIVSLTI